MPRVARNWLFVNHVWYDLAFRTLLSDDRIDPTADNNTAIRKAAEHGLDRVVALLLSDPRVNPAAVDNFINPTSESDDAIQLAAQYGDATIVKLLLADNRVDPAANDNYAIRFAAQKRFREGC